MNHASLQSRASWLPFARTLALRGWNVGLALAVALWAGTGFFEDTGRGEEDGDFEVNVDANGQAYAHFTIDDDIVLQEIRTRLEERMNR